MLKKKIYIPILIVIALGLLYLYKSNTKTDPVAFSEVKSGTITQEVTVSGTVKAKKSVELGFEKSGRVNKIYVSVGDRISQGDLLMTLENGVELATVQDAEAKLASRQAHYSDLKAGGSPEQISVKESGLEKAKSDLATNYASVPNIILDAFNKADNAVRRQADILFNNANSQNPQLSFSSGDQQAAIDAQNGRYSAELVLNKLKILTQTELDTESEKENALTQTKESMLSISDFLIKTNKALNSAVNLSESVLTTDKDAISTARTNVNTALTSVTNQIQTIATQKINVKTASDELALTKAGATIEVLAGALADIDSASANVKNAEALLAKTYIRSPISGTVTRQDAKVGEIAPANSSLVSIGSDNFKVEAFIPEVDVAKISVDDTATITLDAYGNDVEFGARVIQIDPAETIIDGVSTYKTTLEFEKNDPRIRSGMTANTTIVTANVENALSVPQRSVFDKDNKKFVKLLGDNNTSVDQEVKLGIRGSNGEVEILSGLKEGEKVLTNVR